MRGVPAVELFGTHTTSGLPVQLITADTSGISFRNNTGGAFTPADHYISYTADAELS